MLARRPSYEWLTWTQLGLSNKPCGVINTNGYDDLLFQFLDGAVSEGFMKRVHREMLLVSDSAKALIRLLDNFTVPSVDKWIEPNIDTE
ncbi:MAG: LOG family protein [Halioglobus sp.]